MLRRSRTPLLAALSLLCAAMPMRVASTDEPESRRVRFFVRTED